VLIKQVIIPKIYTNPANTIFLFRGRVRHGSASVGR